jgi:hypothetical protein
MQVLLSPVSLASPAWEPTDRTAMGRRAKSVLSGRNPSPVRAERQRMALAPRTRPQGILRPSGSSGTCQTEPTRAGRGRSPSGPEAIPGPATGARIPSAKACECARFGPQDLALRATAGQWHAECKACQIPRASAPSPIYPAVQTFPLRLGRCPYLWGGEGVTLGVCAPSLKPRGCRTSRISTSG